MNSQSFFEAFALPASIEYFVGSNLGSTFDFQHRNYLLLVGDVVVVVVVDDDDAVIYADIAKFDYIYFDAVTDAYWYCKRSMVGLWKRNPKS